MLGELNETQIEDLLSSQIVGRIGCHADGITYVVPVNYAYDGTNIFVHSAKGMKVDMMRKNPEVCFQVDEIRNTANWRSVIAWGKFEEITDDMEREQTMQKLFDRMMSLLTSETGIATHGITARANAVSRQKAIWYRIALNKKTGRFENS